MHDKLSTAAVSDVFVYFEELKIFFLNFYWSKKSGPKNDFFQPLKKQNQITDELMSEIKSLIFVTD